MKKRFLVGGFILTFALVYLGFNFLSSITYYLTPSELKAKDSIFDRKVRVIGKVVTEGFIWDAKELTLRFNITDGKESLLVIYRGVVPDTFKIGSEVVVEGSYTPQGIFEASRILIRCPTKYAPIEKKP